MFGILMPDNPQAPEGIPRGNDTAQQHACDYGQYHPYEPSCKRTALGYVRPGTTEFPGRHMLKAS